MSETTKSKPEEAVDKQLTKNKAVGKVSIENMPKSQMPRSMPAKYCAEQIADYLLVNCIDKEMTNLKLQKLLYYCQYWHMAFYREVLFSDPIEAWEHGPIIRAVYHKYRNYKRLEAIPVPTSAPTLDENAVKTIDKVLDSYGSVDTDWIMSYSSSGTLWFRHYYGVSTYEEWHAEAQPKVGQRYYTIFMPEKQSATTSNGTRDSIDCFNPDDYNHAESIRGIPKKLNLEGKRFLWLYLEFPLPSRSIKCTFDIETLPDLQLALKESVMIDLFGCFLYIEGNPYPNKIHIRSVEPLTRANEDPWFGDYLRNRNSKQDGLSVLESVAKARSIRQGDFID